VGNSHLRLTGRGRGASASREVGGNPSSQQAVRPSAAAASCSGGGKRSPQVAFRKFMYEGKGRISGAGRTRQAATERAGRGEILKYHFLPRSRTEKDRAGRGGKGRRWLIFIYCGGSFLENTKENKEAAGSVGVYRVSLRVW
jgi:hypothetical protein